MARQEAYGREFVYNPRDGSDAPEVVLEGTQAPEVVVPNHPPEVVPPWYQYQSPNKSDQYSDLVPTPNHEGEKYAVINSHYPYSDQNTTVQTHSAVSGQKQSKRRRWIWIGIVVAVVLIAVVVGCVVGLVVVNRPSTATEPPPSTGNASNGDAAKYLPLPNISYLSPYDYASIPVELTHIAYPPQNQRLQRIRMLTGTQRCYHYRPRHHVCLWTWS
jgi:hypothetical protein